MSKKRTELVKQIHNLVDETLPNANMIMHFATVKVMLEENCTKEALEYMLGMLMKLYPNVTVGSVDDLTLILNTPANKSSGDETFRDAIKSIYLPGLIKG